MRWKGSVVRGHQAIAEHEPIIGSGGRTPSGVQGSKPPEAESILVIGCRQI